MKKVLLLLLLLVLGVLPLAVVYWLGGPVFVAYLLGIGIVGAVVPPVLKWVSAAGGRHKQRRACLSHQQAQAKAEAVRAALVMERQQTRARLLARQELRASVQTPNEGQD